MGILRSILRHPEDIYPLMKLKIAAQYAEKQIPSQPHWAFSYTMLHKVSRSFSLVIQQLPVELRDAVCIFYLVLRALATVEDDTSVATEVKVPILMSFHRHLYDREWHFSCGTKDYKVLMDQFCHVSTAFLELGRQKLSRMDDKDKVYLKALSLWETVESENDPPPLGPNPTVAQMKNYKDAKSKKPKTLTCLHSALSNVIFTRIMACETPKEVWEKLKEDFDGSDRVKTVKLLTLKREFEMLRIKEGDTVKEYSSKLLKIINKIRLLGETFLDSKVMEKMIICLLARFESKMSAIEESSDLKTLSIIELISKLQDQEQRTSIRDEKVEEVAFQAKHKGKKPVKDNRRMDGDKTAKRKPWTESSQKEKFPPCVRPV
ncbi:Squalene synthase [Capsicum annuum]|nr:Squalene synthase [Capsicum annuum]